MLHIWVGHKSKNSQRILPNRFTEIHPNEPRNKETHQRKVRNIKHKDGIFISLSWLLFRLNKKQQTQQTEPSCPTAFNKHIYPQ